VGGGGERGGGVGFRALGLGRGGEMACGGGSRPWLICAAVLSRAGLMWAERDQPVLKL
jgi:hypothetical protein